MSVFGRIMSAIFGSSAQAEAAPPPPATTPGAAQAPASAGGSAPAGAPVQNVDVGAVLNGLAAKNPEKLDWRHSIVDLMKLLDLDASLAARKELATELHYDGDMGDSAAMNIWLHKQVMAKLAANGGVVPADLKD